MNYFSEYPVDAVITWVDGGDKNHQKKMLPYVKDIKKINRNRYDQVEEIKYTVDSILKFATFIQKIFIVTDEQTPSFLKSNVKKYTNVVIIDHKIIFEEKEEFLPTFNSRSIETNLFKIPKLSEHFVYFNDDMFLIKETNLNDFFINGLPVLRGKWNSLQEDRWLKNVFYKLPDKTRANHRKGQELGAKILRFKKFYKFSHTPYPLRRSTFINFFKENGNLETQNSKYKFRHYKQFIPQSLINHIEIKNKTCVLKKNHKLVFIQNYKKNLSNLKIKLKLAEYNNNKVFLNLQGLNQCPEEKLTFILNWLKKITN